MRGLTPIWDNDADENDVVVRCAREFAAAFNQNPAAPRLKDIARDARCNRNAVKGHLREAKRRGLISLTLRLPKKGGLSQELAEKYRLAEAVVTLTPVEWGDQKSVRAALAPELVRYFERFCMRLAQRGHDRKHLRIGIDGGLTLYQAVREAILPPLPKFEYELIPLVFGPLEGAKFTVSSASVVASILGSKLEELGAQVCVRDGFTVRADWNHSPEDREPVHFTIEMTSKKTVLPLDIIFVGIGSSTAGLLQRELQSLARSDRAELKHYGDILNLPFDREGREYTSIARSRAVLLSLKDLRRLSQSPYTLVVGVAGGREKVAAIRTVLRCGYISVLITDSTTAIALAEE